ncbi:thiamine pyrophosphate-binding protein [Streptomyces sp. NPDC058171]
MTGCVREAVVGAVAGQGAPLTVFALMGGANQELICALADRDGVRVVHGRHESGVVSMADGYARFGGGLGVATVTAGPGVTNAATALAVARARGSAVLLLAGDTAKAHDRSPQWFEQDVFARVCGGASARVDAPEGLAGALAEARRVLHRGGPFTLNLPVDVQPAPIPGGLPPVRLWPPEQHGSAPPSADAQAALREAAVRLRGAARPVVLAGRGGVHAATALKLLGERLGASLATTLPAAGLFAGHGLDTGMAGALGDGRADAALAEADLLLAVGTSLHPLAGSRPAALAAAGRLIRVDTAPRPGTGGIVAACDAARGVEALTVLLGPPPAPPRTPRPRAPVGAGDTTPHRPVAGRDGPVHPMRAVAELAAALPAERPVVVGGGHAALGACQTLGATGPHDFAMVSADFGAIGQALAVAIGACFARPGERVFHVTGDGELMMGLADLHTAVRYGLDLTVVVLNDQGFAQERHNLARSGRPTAHADHPAPDLAALARSLGAVGHTIAGTAQLPLLRHAVPARSGSGVVLIDVRIDPAYLNPASERIAAVLTGAPGGATAGQGGTATGTGA